MKLYYKYLFRAIPFSKNWLEVHLRALLHSRLHERTAKITIRREKNIENVNWTKSGLIASK